MARLILSLDGSVMAEYNMNKERYTVGRLPDNDIRIDNPAVSGHHSLVINILNDSFLEDLNSTNGTYVNGKLIKKHALQHGDVVTVGHHQLRFGRGALTHCDLRQAQANDALRLQAEKSCVDGELHPRPQHHFFSSRTEQAATVSRIRDTEPVLRLIAG